MTPMPYVTHEELEDLRPVLTPLGSGHYAAADLYQRYVQTMQLAGKKPSHPVRFGQVLKHYGALRKAKYDQTTKKMVKGWLVAV